MDCTGAGTGCGTCQPELQQLLDEALLESDSADLLSYSAV